MSADYQIAERIKSIKQESAVLLNKVKERADLNENLKKALENTLERISQLNRNDLEESECDLISGFLETFKKEAVETVDLDEEKAKQLIETCELFNKRVLFFAEHTKEQIQKLEVNNLRQHCIKLLTSLDSIDSEQLPENFESLSIENLLKLCTAIDERRKHRVYTSIENLVAKLNSLASHRDYRKEKYGQFIAALSAIGITYSSDMNTFSCKNQHNTMLLLEAPIENFSQSALPEPGSYFFDSARDAAEAGLTQAWGTLINECQGYTKRIKVPENERLDVLANHLEAMDRRVEVQCKHCLDRFPETAAQTVMEQRLASLLKLEWLLDKDVLPHHLEMKEQFHQDMLGLLMEVEAALSKIKGVEKEKELNALCGKIENVRAPIVRALLSQEQAAIRQEEKSVAEGHHALGTKKRRIAALPGELAGVEKGKEKLEEKCKKLEESLLFSQEKLSENKEKLEGAVKRKDEIKVEKGKLEREEEAHVKKLEKLLESVKSLGEEKETAEQIYETENKTLAGYRESLEILQSSFIDIGLNYVNLNDKINQLNEKHSKIETSPRGFAIISDHISRAVSSKDALKELDESAFNKLDQLSRELADLVEKHKGVAGFFKAILQSKGSQNKEFQKFQSIFGKLNEVLKESKSIIRKNELNRLKTDLLKDIDALTSQHTHLAEKATGPLSAISRALFRSDKTKSLAEELKNIKAKLSKATKEDEILAQIEAFKKLVGSESFRKSGTTVKDNVQSSREAHMNYLHSKWQHEGKDSLDVYVESAVRPINKTLQQCVGYQDEIEKLITQQEKVVEPLKEKSERLAVELSKKVLEKEVLQEEIKRLNSEIERLSGKDGEEEANNKKIEEYRKNIDKFKEAIASLEKQIDECKKGETILQQDIAKKEEELRAAQSTIESDAKVLKQKEDALAERKAVLSEINILRNALGETYVATMEPEAPLVASAELSVSPETEEVAPVVESLASLIGDDEDEAKERLVAAPAKTTRSIRVIKEEIASIETSIELSISQLLYAIEEFLDDEIFDQGEGVFTENEPFVEKNLKELKEELTKILKELEGKVEEKDFAYVVNRLSNLHCNSRTDIKQYAQGCPSNDRIQDFVKRFPDYTELLADVNNASAKLAELAKELDEVKAKAEQLQREKQIRPLEEILSAEDLAEDEKDGQLSHFLSTPVLRANQEQTDREQALNDAADEDEPALANRPHPITNAPAVSMFGHSNGGSRCSNEQSKSRIFSSIAIGLGIKSDGN